MRGYGAISKITKSSDLSPPKYISTDLSLSIDTSDEFVCVSNCAMSFEDPLRANTNDLIKISMS